MIVHVKLNGSTSTTEHSRGVEIELPDGKITIMETTAPKEIMVVIEKPGAEEPAEIIWSQILDPKEA